MISLVVDRTWNGERVPAEERAEITLRPSGRHLAIEVDAPYHGDPAPPAPPGSFEGLWEYEVVELFVAEEGTDSYTEIELSPHGHYLVLRFAGVRRGVERRLPLELEAAIEGRRWSAAARVAISHLPPRPWTANAYAVHGVGAERRYLAMIPVPGERPDFHRPEVFHRIC